MFSGRNPREIRRLLKTCLFSMARRSFQQAGVSAKLVIDFGGVYGRRITLNLTLKASPLMSTWLKQCKIRRMEPFLNKGRYTPVLRVELIPVEEADERWNEKVLAVREV